MVISITLSVFIDPPLEDGKFDLSTLAPMIRKYYKSNSEIGIELNEIEKVAYGNDDNDDQGLDQEQKEPLNKSSTENINGKPE